jgi:hypothetical protein
MAYCTTATAGREADLAVGQKADDAPTVLGFGVSDRCLAEEHTADAKDTADAEDTADTKDTADVEDTGE